MGLSPTSIYGISFSVAGYGRPQTWKRWCGVVLISLSSLGQESDPPSDWEKVWFFLRNDADTPLVVFTGCRPVPQPKWGYGVA
jgi:hypothetical protein